VCQFFWATLYMSDVDLTIHVGNNWADFVCLNPRMYGLKVDNIL